MAAKGNPNIAKIGKKFSKDYQPKNNGRPVNRFKELQGQYELSSDDIRNLIAELMNLDVVDLKDIIKNPSTPVLKASLAAAIVGSLKKGNLDAITIMLDRSFGKPTQKTEASVSITAPPNLIIQAVDPINIDESYTDTTKDSTS